jgi:ankyrin repeat protein
VVLLLINQLVNELADQAGPQNRLEPNTLANCLTGIAGPPLSDSQTQTALRSILDAAQGLDITQSMRNPALHMLIRHGKSQALGTLMPHPPLAWTEAEVSEIWEAVGPLVINRSVWHQNAALNTVTALYKLGLPIQSAPDTIVLQIAANGPVNLMSLLLNNGVSPTISDNEGNSLLHRAVRGNRKEMISVLLEHGATLTANNAGVTALQEALSLGLGTTMAVIFYLHQGGLNTLDDDGYAPLHRAILEVPIPPASAGAEGALHTPEYQYARTRIQALIEAGADVNQRCGVKHVGKTPLHLAHRIAHRSIRSSVVSLLIQFKASPHSLDYKLRFPSVMQGRGRSNSA